MIDIYVLLFLTLIIGIVFSTISYFLFHNSKYFDKVQGGIISISVLFFGFGLGINDSLSLSYYFGICVLSILAYFVGLSYMRVILDLAKERKEKKIRNSANKTEKS